MLYLVHRVTISIKLRPVKLEQSVSESLPHKGLDTELLGVQSTCLDSVPASIRACNAQEINLTNCDVTTWSWVNLVHPRVVQPASSATRQLTITKDAVAPTWLCNRTIPFRPHCATGQQHQCLFVQPQQDKTSPACLDKVGQIGITDLMIYIVYRNYTLH